MHPFTYSRPATAAEAVSAIVAGGPGARLLAGGTTIYDLMKLNVEKPTHLIDITRLEGLDCIDAGGAELTLGALARMSDVAAHPQVVAEFPALSESLWRAASQQLRNMATLGGNLLQRTRCAYFRGGEPFPCNKRKPGSGCAAQHGLDRGQALLGGSDACTAVYPGDLAIALVAFDATIDVLGPRGERTITVEELYREPGDEPHIETNLGPDEMILRIRVPKDAAGRASTYHKIRDRESYAFALASAAVALDVDGDRVRAARIAIGGLATRPWRARAAEQALCGKVLTSRAAREAGETALQGANPGRDNVFRIELGVRTVADALMIAKHRT
ncbi:xanthine dehydrogenase family protein subunit M (plasmid) [Microvirga terrae]|uniref:Xanthine dehydrogenase family protein subunit M n=1 Tax=Microvirga terrae TaxID=2740529 RepID=A0ABY5S0T5_9HYPH|nr:xanthine dehydrogenase family protein subunit M [Microvirga terrae]UVF22191.1 xanthine dehydrogenase family protein subunit M [Microvirga terrae]